MQLIFSVVPNNGFEGQENINTCNEEMPRTHNDNQPRENPPSESQTPGISKSQDIITNSAGHSAPPKDNSSDMGDALNSSSAIKQKNPTALSMLNEYYDNSNTVEDASSSGLQFDLRERGGEQHCLAANDRLSTDDDAIKKSVGETPATESETNFGDAGGEFEKGFAQQGCLDSASKGGKAEDLLISYSQSESSSERSGCGLRLGTEEDEQNESTSVDEDMNCLRKAKDDTKDEKDKLDHKKHSKKKKKKKHKKKDKKEQQGTGSSEEGEELNKKKCRSETPSADSAGKEKMYILKALDAGSMSRS